MTLRETVAEIIQDETVLCGDFPYVKANSAADAILAEIREHMTSPEAVERAVDGYRDYGGGRYVEQPGWRDSISPLVRAAILAALGTE